jgi:spore coat protein CotH
MLYSEIARHYVATPKTNYVRVVINGENWGVCINAQQFNSDFTREWYASGGGARWKVPGSPMGRAGMSTSVSGPTRTGRSTRSRRRTIRNRGTLVHMFRVLNETPLAKLEGALSPLLDIDCVLKFLAVEVALVNTDGYWTRASDYSIYLDEKGRFHVVPHDFNEAMSEGRGFGFRFGGGGSVNLDPLVGLDDPTKATATATEPTSENRIIAAGSAPPLPWSSGPRATAQPGGASSSSWADPPWEAPGRRR